jgi:di/tricarboxylate transporter
MQIAFILAVLAAAAILFSLERVPVDVVALGVLVALLATGILTPSEALAGFASEAVVVIGGLFVLTAALRHSGALDILSGWVQRSAGQRPGLAYATLLALVAATSAFMNNTTTTAVFVPVAIALARTLGRPPSQVLMPVAFASILGGTITLIGTSTNVIASGLLPDYQLAPLRMFELTPVGLPSALLGVAYLLAVSRRLLPGREEVELAQRYHIRDYLTEVVVMPRSPLVGQTVAEAALGRRWDLNLVAILRGKVTVSPEPEVRLAEGDLLLVESRLDALLGLGESVGLAIRRGPEEGAAEGLLGPGGKLVEALVLPRSNLTGRTLQESRFRQRYGASVVALNRHAEAVLEKLGRIPLRVGDVLLIHGQPAAISRLLTQTGLLVLSDREVRGRTPRLAAATVAIFGTAVALATTGLVTLSGAILLGCLSLLVIRSLTPQEAYEAVDWRMLVLIAGMMALGRAMTKTGAVDLLADAVVDQIGGLGPLGLLAGFYLLTVLLTQPMSNQAAALVVLPVAIGVALEAGINPRAMAVTVTLAASSSFLTPLEPSCLLVYGPGRYRFFDFPRLGAGLTLLVLLLTLLVVPAIWGL